jgi:prepilin-type N-terminal cleavage/methylation domain-containing protein
MSNHAYFLNRRSNLGFTLVELAIVLVIVALLSGGLMMTVGAQMDLIANSETQRRLNDARDALLGYAASNGRLPRPAVSATDGTEMPAASCSIEANCTGFIPWQVLGVHKADSWGKLIRYSVSPAFTNAISLTTPGTKKIQGRDSSGNLIYLFGQASSCTTNNPCAPAVIYSQGKQRFGTGEDGTAFSGGSTTSIDEANNDTGSVGPIAGTVYISRTPTDNVGSPGGEFDDIVIWLSPNILYNRLITAGRLP